MVQDQLSSSVPVIDISALATDPEVARQVVEAAQWPGFFHVVGHGVPEAAIDELRRTSEHLFLRTPESDLADCRRDATNSRGYFDDELTKQKRDWKRCLDVGCQEGGKLGGRSEVDGENRWPREESAPGLRSSIETFVPHASAVALRLLGTLVSALGNGHGHRHGHGIGFPVDESADTYVRHVGATHSSFLRLNFYPPCPDTQADTVKGIERHTDAGLLTILLHDDVEALQVRVPPRPSAATTATTATATTTPAAPPPAERWEFVRPLPGAFTVNVGDMLTVLSDGRFPAPEHRVLANGGARRFSYAFFLNPGYDDIIAPLPSSPPAPPRFQPVRWSDFRRRRYEGDVRDAGEEVQVTQWRSTDAAS